MNILEQARLLEQLPDAALQREMQQPTGSTPSYLVVTEIDRRNKLRQGASVGAGEPPTVASQVTEQINQQQPVQTQQTMAGARSVGIAAVPGTQPPPMQKMAGGGIVAFKKGGEVCGYAGGGLPRLSLDEEIARDFLLFGKPDVTIVVVDATALQRNLNLALQVLEITGRVVVCLNLLDEAHRKGLQVSVRRLSDELGVPVAGCVARTGEGLAALKDRVVDMAEGRITTTPRRATYPPVLDAALARVVPLVEQHLPGVPNARWIGMRLLEGDPRVTEAVLKGELAPEAGAGGRAPQPAWQTTGAMQPA